MFTAFSTALSALNANTTALDVVSNNLANLNTTGFKASTVSFQDLVTESLGAGVGTTQVGFGTGTPYTECQFTQGAIQSASGLLDGAVQGSGFFVVNDSQGDQQFTRAGDFEANSAATSRRSPASSFRDGPWTPMAWWIPTSPSETSPCRSAPCRRPWRARPSRWA